MSNLPQVFRYEGREVRVVMKFGEPWWVAKDVCDALALDQVSRAVDRLAQDERGVLIITHPQNPGRLLEVNGVNEPGLYRLIMTSTKPEAEAFKRWIVHDVLPAIRKTGAYSVDLPRTFAQALRLAADQAEAIEHQQKLLAEAQPKVEFFDAVTGSKDAIEIGKVAKVLGIPGVGRNNLFALLREKGVLMSGNVPFQEHLDRGRFRVIEQKWQTPEGETRISIKTLVHQKGVDHIRRILTDAPGLVKRTGER